VAAQEKLRHGKIGDRRAHGFEDRDLFCISPRHRRIASLAHPVASVHNNPCATKYIVVRLAHRRCEAVDQGHVAPGARLLSCTRGVALAVAQQTVSAHATATARSFTASHVASLLEARNRAANACAFAKSRPNTRIRL
jgi:hypothetical protein